jgi:hypothetical protein
MTPSMLSPVPVPLAMLIGEIPAMLSLTWPQQLRVLQ